jgi:hypothetical protein
MTDLGKGFYATMQVGGAMVAAGTVEQIKKQLDQIATDPSGTPTGKDVVARKLNEQKKKLAKQFSDNITSFASELTRYEKFQPEAYERDREKFLEATDRALWAVIFPSIDYEDLNAFYQKALTTITQALTEFNRQYKMWSEARVRYARSGAPRYGYADYQTAGEDYQKRYQEYERRQPFRPNLNLY